MLLNKVTKKLIGFLAHHNYGSGIFLKMELKTLQSQNLKFQEIGLDRNKAISKLNTVLDQIYGTNYTEKNGMWSEHLILFAGLSNSSNEIKNILEKSCNVPTQTSTKTNEGKIDCVSSICSKTS